MILCNYFLSLLQIYITVNLRKKRRNETINPEPICDPARRDIDFEYTSQLLAKTVIIVLILKLIKHCEHCLKSVAVHNSEERTFKSSLNRFKQQKR